MLKKLLFCVICVTLFNLCYYITNSFTYALTGMFALILYGVWLIRFEIGIPLSKEKRAKNSKKRHQKFKEAHDKNTRDNPTI